MQVVQDWPSHHRQHFGVKAVQGGHFIRMFDVLRDHVKQIRGPGGYDDPVFLRFQRLVGAVDLKKSYHNICQQ